MADTDKGDLPTGAEFLEDIQSFCKQYDMAVTRFGMLAMNNGAMVNHLRNGRTVTLETARKTYVFMKEYDKKEGMK